MRQKTLYKNYKCFIIELQPYKHHIGRTMLKKTYIKQVNKGKLLANMKSLFKSFLNEYYGVCIMKYGVVVWFYHLYNNIASQAGF